jgi:hypothetical protein
MDPSEQTCHNFKPRNYHKMCMGSTLMVSDILRFLGSNPTFLCRIHSLDYCPICVVCRRTKERAQMVASLVPLRVPPRTRYTAGLDILTRAPVRAGFDSVSVVVDH